MDKNGFYVTLPSNASMQIYPNNKIWGYRTKLAKPIVLNEPVGVIELQYPWVWENFPAKRQFMILKQSKKWLSLLQLDFMILYLE